MAIVSPGRVPLLVLTFVLAAALTPEAQNAPPRDTGGTASAAQGTGAITGTVTVAGTGSPARRARVVLSGSGLRGSRSVAADDEGRFAFGALTAGRYTVSASKPGYVSVVYGQHRPGSGRPGTPIRLGDGQRVSISLQMPRGAVISGTVLDEHGEEVPGTLVRAYRYTMQSGIRTLQQAGTDTTDDRGIYRIYGLQPGQYIVGATPRRGPANGAFQRMEIPAPGRGRGGSIAVRGAAVGDQGGGEGEDQGYAPVFYPGTTSAANATAVETGAGEERLGVDFQLQLVPLATISGMVIAPSGDARGTVVRLINTGDDVSGLGNSVARPSGDGTFEITGVAPGRYTLVARAMIGGRDGRGPGGRAGTGRGGAAGDPGIERLWAQSDVTVDGHAVSGVVLALQPGLTVAGRVDFHGGSPPDPARVRVTLIPAEITAAGRETATTAAGPVDDSGRFTITGVMPGRYRLSATSPGWTLVSALVGGQDAADLPIEVRTGSNISGATLTMSDAASSLSGIVTNDRAEPLSDYTLIVYPADSRYWLPQARRIRAVRPGTDGSFSVEGLPAGDYRLAPVLDPEPGAWFDPGFLQQIDAAAMGVTLMDGEKKVQNVRLAGA
jgi:protocatechuate 3,4-dioxygenase beta subunit